MKSAGEELEATVSEIAEKKNPDNLAKIQPCGPEKWKRKRKIGYYSRFNFNFIFKVNIIACMRVY